MINIKKAGKKINELDHLLTEKLNLIDKESDSKAGRRQ
jgi:hypothetical protein